MPVGAWRPELADEWGARKIHGGVDWSRVLRITRNLPGKGGRGRSVCESLEVCTGVWQTVLCS